MFLLFKRFVNVRINHSGDGVTCIDVDECSSPSLNNCHGNAACSNVIGGFTCACNTGYQGNGVECTDVNECDASPCGTSAECANTDGRYLL